jgi:hypothetical protein
MNDPGRTFLIRFAIAFLVFALALAGFMEWLDSIFGTEAG